MLIFTEEIAGKPLQRELALVSQAAKESDQFLLAAEFPRIETRFQDASLSQEIRPRRTQSNRNPVKRIDTWLRTASSFDITQVRSAYSRPIRQFTLADMLQKSIGTNPYAEVVAAVANR